MTKEEFINMLEGVPDGTEIDIIVNDGNDNFYSYADLEYYDGTWEFVVTLEDRYEIGEASDMESNRLAVQRLDDFLIDRGYPDNSLNGEDAKEIVNLLRKDK